MPQQTTFGGETRRYRRRKRRKRDTGEAAEAVTVAVMEVKVGTEQAIGGSRQGRVSSGGEHSEKR